jgi:hypothetical protein
MATVNWDVFISHASEDKESVAEPLAQSLRAVGVSVWYDRFQLRLGDRLLRSINDGLKHSRFGVVILSPSFFNKHWPQLELDGLAQREEAGQKVILPIWKDVTLQEVRERSPLLADRIAARWSEGLNAVVEEILSVVLASATAENSSENLVLAAVLRIKQRTRFLWQQLLTNVNTNLNFTAAIRGDTLEAIKGDLATLRDYAGLDYDIRQMIYDTYLGTEINEIIVERMTPALSKAVTKVHALSPQEGFEQGVR